MHGLRRVYAVEEKLHARVRESSAGRVHVVD